jgi:hypothetical protein
MLKIATTDNCGIRISMMMGGVNMYTSEIIPRTPTRLGLDPHHQKHLLGALLLAVLLKLVMIPKAGFECVDIEVTVLRCVLYAMEDTYLIFRDIFIMFINKSLFQDVLGNPALHLLILSLSPWL